MIRPSSSARALIAAAAVFVAVVALIAIAAGNHVHPGAKTSATAASGAPSCCRTPGAGAAHDAHASPGAAGIIVAIDPETGQLGMPTREQIAELSASEKQAISRSAEGLVEEHHPDGSVSIDLQGRFQDFTVVHMGKDGKPVLECLEDAPSVTRALNNGPAPAAEER